MKAIRNIWTPEVRFMQQDEILRDLVSELGTEMWPIIADQITGTNEAPRTGKQCRDRWYNYLDPSLNSSEWLPSEEDAIFELARAHGNCWSIIARSLPGRSVNSIKNYFHATVRKNIRRANKKLVLKKKISGTVRNLMKKNSLEGLIFCNPRKSKIMLEKVRKQMMRLSGIHTSEIEHEINKGEDIYSASGDTIPLNHIEGDDLWLQYWNFLGGIQMAPNK